MMSKALLRRCIEDCRKCIAHCKSMDNMTSCIKTCEDCIECCKMCLTASFHHAKTHDCLMRMCVSACSICEKECSKHDHTECKRCAASCRKCKMSCGSSSSRKTMKRKMSGGSTGLPSSVYSSSTKVPTLGDFPLLSVGDKANSVNSQYAV